MTKVFTVGVIGASNVQDSFSGGWVIELQKALQVGHRSIVKTVAVGKNSQTSNWGLANIQPLIDLKPDMILLDWTNDAFHSYQNTPPENMNLAKSASNWNAMIDMIQSQSPATKIFCVTLPKPTAVAQASLYPNLAAYDAQEGAIAAAQGVDFIDIRAEWGNPADYPSEYPADGVHVYQSAHLRVTIPVLVRELGPLFD